MKTVKLVPEVIALPTLPRTEPITESSGLEPTSKLAHPGLFKTEEFASAINGMKVKTTPDLLSLTRQDPMDSYTPELRVQFMAASIELNNRGIMPVLRPARRAGRPEKDKPYSAPDAQYSNDLRIVDIDYLAKHHPNGHGDIFNGLLADDGTANFAKAEKFASHKGKSGAKAELLQITPAQQVELFIVRDEATRKRWGWLLTNRRKHLVMIHVAINAGYGRKKDDPEHLWQLYCLCVMHNWNTATVLNSAPHLAYSMMPGQLRKSIDWFKKKSKLPAQCVPTTESA